MGRVRVALNLVPIGPRAGGIGTYARELALALGARDDVALRVLLSRNAPDELRDALAGLRVVDVPVRIDGRLPWHLPAQFAAAAALAPRTDVFHSVANAGPFCVPGVRCVITLHDLIWLHHAEEWGTPEQVAAMKRFAIPAVRRADRVLADSHHAADDIAATLGVPRDRIDVAPLAVRPEARAATGAAELRARLELGDAPVVLSVAQKRPYKNHAALIRALAGLGEAVLVLPGAPTPYEDELRALAAELAVEARVRFLSWVDDADLEGLYALAACVALPSRYEGFGLPLLEAMGRGAPVVCSERTALGEVAGDAALVVDPDDQPALTAAIARVLADPALREDLAARGRARAAEFTWDRCAEETVAAYRRA